MSATATPGAAPARDARPGRAGGADTAGTRRVLGWIAVAVSVVTVLFLAVPDLEPPYATTSEAADGTDVLRRVLEGLGTEVQEGDADDLVDTLTPSDVAVLFRDQLDDAQELALAAHVRAGGDVVVAAPGSAPAGALAIRPEVGASGPPGCDALPPRTVLDAAEDPFAAVPAPPPADVVELAGEPEQACWRDGDTALVAIFAGLPGVTAGERDGGAGGRTVVLGDADLVANAAIMADPDLAQLAALFLPRGPDGRVVVLVGDRPPPPPVGVEGAVPDHLRRAMWLVVLGLGTYALARARRLGRVVVEPPPVEVPASALASGIAELLERHDQAADAAARLRAGLRADVAPRLGADGRDPAVLVPLVARATGLATERVALALADGPVAGEADLVAVAAAGREVRAALSTDHDDPLAGTTP